MDSLKSNRTWHLVPLTANQKDAQVLRRKHKHDVTIDKNKTRFVGKDFRQRENVDFFDTFYHENHFNQSIDF